MPTITIKVTDLATPQLRALNESLRSPDLIAQLGKGLEVALRDHFRDRNMASNSESRRAQMGFPQAGIWNRIRQTTHYIGVNGSTASVGISEPAFRAKLFGLSGMTARRSKYLAIARDSRTYGRPARGHPVAGKTFKWTSKKTGKSYIAVRENGALKVLYRLMLSVTVQKDERALPTADQVGARVRPVVMSFLRRRGEGAA
jgi:hypothetical protein